MCFSFQQMMPYERRMSDWSSDVCSSDLNERHRADGARIDLDQIDLARLDRELDVHQPLDRKRARQRVGLPLDLGDERVGQAVRRARTRAVARMDAGFLDMLEHARNDALGAVGDRVDIALDRVPQTLIDQNWLTQTGPPQFRESVDNHV